MAALQYKAKHNKVSYLLKPTESDDYHNIIDFLMSSHIRYALTSNPIIFDSLVKQFWSIATLRAPELGPPAILDTINMTPYTITEDLVRSHLKLADDGGVADLPILEIYSGMGNLGYVTEGKLTFFKNKFLPQWRFLVHTLLHCLSPKSGSWDQYGSPIAIALICLSDGRHFNLIVTRLRIDKRSLSFRMECWMKNWQCLWELIDCLIIARFWDRDNKNF
nr:hypothetical protein [Tanacetum cinerariifolium]